MAQDKIYIYGKHSVSEALRNMPRVVEKVFLSPEGDIDELKDSLKKANIAIEKYSPTALFPGIEKNTPHQGIIAQIATDTLVCPYKEFIEGITVTPDTALALLGGIQDPQNVGAIVRSAAAFGISGVLIPEHNQASITGAVIKASSGMVFRVPLVSIGNVNTTLRDLKERGFWIYGLDETATNPLAKEVFDAPALFVLGNEAKGIREKTREACDILLSIPMNSRCESLNVSASAAIAFYEWSKEHPDALR